MDTRVNNHGYVRLLPDDRIAYTVTRDALNRILMHWDLSEDIIYRGGFNVYGAENGNLEHLKKRAASFSSFREYITTQAATQAGTEDVPLRFGDGRKPHELRPAGSSDMGKSDKKQKQHQVSDRDQEQHRVRAKEKVRAPQVLPVRNLNVCLGTPSRRWIFFVACWQSGAYAHC